MLSHARHRLLLAVGLVGFSGVAEAQRVVVSHDEWFSGACCFGVNEQRFVNNTLGWFGVGSGGTALIYSSNGFLTNTVFTSYLTSLGISVTINAAAASFSGYDAVFSAGNPALNAPGLTSYVQGGGNVVYIGGTGTGGAPGEAAYSNPFLNSFGMKFASSYNGLGTVNTLGFDSQGPYGASLFTGVSSMYALSGSSISLTAPVAGVTTQLFSTSAGQGVFGAATYGSVVPEPATVALMATGLLALVPMVRRRRQR